MAETILLVESDEKLKGFWEEALSKDGSVVVCAENREEALTRAKSQSINLIFLGSGLDRDKALGLLKEIQGINKDVLVIAPTNPDLLKDELEAMRQTRRAQKSSAQVDRLHVEICEAFQWKGLKEKEKEWLQKVRAEHRFENLLGESQDIRDAMKAVLEIVQSKTTTALITGETGTGKEVVARAIHQNSPQKDKPFLQINCTTIAENLLESELFGHVAGAFTDAKTDKPGLLEMADGGTLFLDEIGDMPFSAQSKLLGVLENKRFRRLGGTRDIQVDLRIIAATHKDLAEEVRTRRFRQDLYYRLKVFPIALAPLRQRSQDILPLAHHFLEQFRGELNKKLLGLSFAAQKNLKEYPWPGNVRELKNVIERAVLLAKGEWISPQELMLAPSAAPSAGRELFAIPPEGLKLSDMEKELIGHTLKQTGGNISQAARLLGITRFSLMNRIKKYEIV